MYVCMEELHGTDREEEGLCCRHMIANYTKPLKLQIKELISPELVNTPVSGLLGFDTYVLTNQILASEIGISHVPKLSLPP